MRSTARLLLAATLFAAAGCQETSTTGTSTTSSSAGASSTPAGGAATPAATSETPPATPAADLTAAEKSMEIALTGDRTATLRYTDLRVGNGSIAGAGKVAMVHYTGWLTDGTKFDSSLDRGQPYQFRIGDVPPAVIAGWDHGIRGMRVGGKRKLVIPPDLGYGARGAGGGVIPPNATLVFDVELVGLQ